MAREGADVLLPDIQRANAEAVANEVKALGRKALAQPVDVTREAQIRAAIGDWKSKHPGAEAGATAEPEASAAPQAE